MLTPRARVLPAPLGCQRCQRIILTAAITVAVLWSPFSSSALRAQDPAGKHVLLLYSHESATYADLDKPLRRSIAKDVTHPVDFYTEYLDLIRFPMEKHERQTVDYLRIKYKDRRIDLIVVVSPLAYDFLLPRADELFAGVPIVFASVNTSRLEGRQPHPNVTGVAVQRDQRDTLDLALRIHPDTIHVVVPAGSSPVEKGWLEGFRDSFKRYEGRVAFTYLTDLPMHEMQRRLQTLPPHSLVLFTMMLYTDSTGDYFRPEDAAALVAASSNAPVYGTDEPFLGNGIVGGRLYDLEAVGVAAGKIGQRILSGEQPADIPIHVMDPNRNAFDARQLVRWGIDERRLPPGSAVLFRERTLWTQYRGTVIATATVVAAQTALVSLLLVQRARRRRAEQALRTSEGALRRSYADVQDLAGRLISAQESERRRIARELHDELSQKLTLLGIEIGRLALRPPASLAAVADVARELSERTGSIAGDVHRLSHDLHPAKLEIIGLVSALEGLCREVSQQYDVRVEFRHRGMEYRIPSAHALCLFRIAQEALHNVVKHSGASAATVRLIPTRFGVRLRVADRGRGFDATVRDGEGLGLLSMRERIHFAGGRIALRSAAGRGTRIVVNLPIRDQAALRSADARRARTA
jgi:signal transduction histidine kinase